MRRRGGAPPSVALDELSDDELVRLAGAGHEKAFDAIVSRRAQALFEVCFALDPARAEALFAATVDRARGELRTGSGLDGPFDVWLFQLAHDEAGPEEHEEAEPEERAG